MEKKIKYSINENDVRNQPGCFLYLILFLLTLGEKMKSFVHNDNNHLSLQCEINKIYMKE